MGNAQVATGGEAIWLSFCFVPGFAPVFMALGTSATILGQVLLRRRYDLNTTGGTVLTASAASATVKEGIMLFATYKAGHGILFLLVAAFTGQGAGRLKSLGRIGQRLDRGAGMVMILMGIAMITGHLLALSYWQLEASLVFARIG